ncbi:hypothetical protein QOT17_021052 [Balamuthia mandrillaris]
MQSRCTQVNHRLAEDHHKKLVSKSKLGGTRPCPQPECGYQAVVEWELYGETKLCGRQDGKQKRKENGA